ncbi:MAG: DUF2795 domain-containing protein [Patescibacteria group bacterium]|nr:DUF2795 domain-containing protein [Patescibacteria group bacterium]MDE2172568.1 DUF2795 domain-containing protein [Patescibacteria group bacterium]
MTARSPNPVEIQSYLKGVAYPATKDDIVDQAKSNEAPERIMELLDRMTDREYDTPAAVTRELGSIQK